VGVASTFAAVGLVGLVINHLFLTETRRCCGGGDGADGSEGGAGDVEDVAGEERAGLLSEREDGGGAEATTSGDDTDDEQRKGVEKARD